MRLTVARWKPTLATTRLALMSSASRTGLPVLMGSGATSLDVGSNGRRSTRLAAVRSARNDDGQSKLVSVTIARKAVPTAAEAPAMTIAPDSGSQSAVSPSSASVS